MSQIETVKNRLLEVGYVDNFWALDNYILRLGAIVHTLKHKHGLVISGSFGKELGKVKPLWKNFYYIIHKTLHKESRENVENKTESPTHGAYGQQAQLW